jgi:hypothetical protein
MIHCGNSDFSERREPERREIACEYNNPGVFW